MGDPRAGGGDLVAVVGVLRAFGTRRPGKDPSKPTILGFGDDGEDSLLIIVEVLGQNSGLRTGPHVARVTRGFLDSMPVSGEGPGPRNTIKMML